MSITIPTQEQLRDRALMLLQKHLAAGKDAAPVQVNAIEAGMRRETNRVLAFMHAGVAEGILQYLRDFIARQAVPINATGQWLDDWCRTYGIRTKAASRATGAATGTGTAGAILPQTQQLQRADGRIYTPQADLTVAPDGSLTGTVQAVDGGSDGNALGGITLRLINPVPGIGNELTVTPEGINGGADREKESERLSPAAEPYPEPTPWWQPQ